MTSHITIRELTTGPGGAEWTWTGVCNRDACTQWPYGPPWKEGTREEVVAWAETHALKH